MFLAEKGADRRQEYRAGSFRENISRQILKRPQAIQVPEEKNRHRGKTSSKVAESQSTWVKFPKGEGNSKLFCCSLPIYRRFLRALVSARPDESGSYSLLPKTGGIKGLWIEGVGKTVQK